MPQKIIFICQDCKSEWDTEENTRLKTCGFCGSTKIYKSYHHQRAAKKSRRKQRWSYRVK